MLITLKNLLAFLERVSLQGREVDAYQECRNLILIQIDELEKVATQNEAST